MEFLIVNGKFVKVKKNNKTVFPVVPHFEPPVQEEEKLTVTSTYNATQTGNNVVIQ